MLICQPRQPAAAPLDGRSLVLGVACGLLSACLCLTSLFPAQAAAPPRVLPEGKVPADVRLEPLVDLNGYFPMRVPKTRQAWERRAQKLRRQVLVATGLWPMPARTPLNAVVHGRTARDGFTVEKVYFESYPNHFVTGLLFRPVGKKGRGPAVLCPHGHGGRLQNYNTKEIRQLIVQGAERFEESGRYPKLARCAQLARMGCVVLIFDMVGYVDSVQIPRDVAHGFQKQRPEMNGPDRWGFFSTAAELRLQSIMGLQTWNSVRALDFLCSLPDVDPQRVALTGGSGGGTQTILLGAIDARPVVAFPQGMVSTAMQGGCTCENCCLLRIGTGNVELAALFAPRPLGMTAANDWTKEMPTKGFPQLKSLYTLLGVPDRVICKSLVQFPHNYNYVTRAVMYGWLNQYLNLGLPQPVVEEDYRLLTSADWSVWDDQHPRPSSGPEYERSLVQTINRQAEQQIAALRPTDPSSLARYREIVGGAFSTLLGRTLADVGGIRSETVDQRPLGRWSVRCDLVRMVDHGEELPVVSLRPAKAAWNRQVVLWIDGDGKAGMFDSQGQPRAEIQRLLDAGMAVVSADLLDQGEFVRRGKPAVQARVVDNPREFAGFTFGYNRPLFAQRVADILSLIAYAHSEFHDPAAVHLVGINGGGPLATAARAQAGAAIDRAAVDTGRFRFARLTSYRDVRFLPGAVKYGDLPALLALSAPHPLWLAGEKGELPPAVRAAYRAAGREGLPTSSNAPPDQIARAAVDWLLRP
jgi:dienelactone hydrolase